MSFPWQDESTLRRLYHDRKMSMSEVADELGCTPSTICDWMSRHGIETEDSEAARSRSHIGSEAYDVLSDEDELRKLYEERRWSAVKIGDELDCHNTTVLRHMEKHGIDARDAAESTSLGRVGTAAHRVLSDADKLRELYVDDRMSSLEIANELGCDDTTVRQWMSRHGIETRSLSESRRGKLTGSDNPAWNGGYESYYGPDWSEQRRKRLERDDYQCVVCTLSNEEHKVRHGRELHVHHIEPFCKFEGPDGSYDHEKANRLENLLTLCQPHHIRWEGIPLRPQA